LRERIEHEYSNPFLVKKKENADYPIKEIQDAILVNDAVKQSEPEFGRKNTVDFDLAFEKNDRLWIKKKK
jgi:hypothetical protein